VKSDRQKRVIARLAKATEAIPYEEIASGASRPRNDGFFFTVYRIEKKI